ncbi:uncharacterized protein PG986_006417 [Apiospora aurea]|uniref:Uncharacterized protein n=1 Tax=Apiospora aurea TaxID=335848 RepID=A0ABR1QKD9_9PEZI
METFNLQLPRTLLLDDSKTRFSAVRDILPVQMHGILAQDPTLVEILGLLSALVVLMRVPDVQLRPLQITVQIAPAPPMRAQKPLGHGNLERLARYHISFDALVFAAEEAVPRQLLRGAGGGGTSRLSTLPISMPIPIRLAAASSSRVRRRPLGSCSRAARPGRTRR